ncbi:ABC transporter ATP-binding protein (plasmid) [Tistrella bauzanensis]|uniref:ABC transporter ATP-binding protein n=1 Tax=Tistrella TaxID=171436 RepID=UPI0031F6D168
MTAGPAFRRLLSRLIAAGGRGRITRLAILQVAAAVSESLSLALLLPLLRMIQLPGTDGASTAAGGQTGSGWTAIDRLLGGLSPAQALVAVLVVFVGITLLRGLLLRAREVHGFHLSVDMAAHLRAGLFGAAARAPWRVLAREPRGRLLGLLTGEVDRISNGITMLLRLPALAVMAVAQIAVAAWISPPLTLAALLIGGFSAMVVRRRSRASFQQGTMLSTRHAVAAREVRDFLDGLKPAKGQGVELRHARNSASALRDTGLGMLTFIRDSATTRMVMQSVGAIAMAVLIIIGALGLKLPGPELILLAVICARLLPMAQEFQQSAQRVAHMLPALVALEAAERRLNGTADPTTDLPQAMPVPDHAPRLQLDAVFLAHRPDAHAQPDAPTRSDIPTRSDAAGLEAMDGETVGEAEAAGQMVLNGASAVFPAGRITAVVGPSGAGKTTLIDLLLGLLPPDRGVVSIDGAPLDEALATSWRRQVGWVPQEPFLTDASLRDNLIWSADPDRHPVDDGTLIRMLDLAGLTPVLAGLPQGLDTPLGDRGNRLSGGERQRVTLARALLRRPRLLLLDEPTSALDTATEAGIRTMLTALKGEATVIVITHRPALLETADQVLHMADGQFAAAG